MFKVENQSVNNSSITNIPNASTEYIHFIKTVEQLAISYPQKEAFAYLKNNGTTERFTFLQAFEIIEKTISYLTTTGIKAGDRVAIISKTTPLGFLTSIALSYMNVVSVFIDPSIPKEEVDRLLEFSDISAIFTTEVYYKNISSHICNMIPAFDIEKSNDINPYFDGSPKTVTYINQNKDLDVITILYSSGTTASAKGVMMTYHSVIRGREIFSDLYGLRSETTLMQVLPINHISGYMSTMVYFLSGNSIGMVEDFNATKLLKSLLEYNPHHFVIIPKVYDVIASKLMDEVHNKGIIAEFFIKTLMKTSGFLYKTFGIKNKICKPIYSKIFGKNLNSLGVGGSICTKETAIFYQNMGLMWANLYATTETGVPITSTGRFDKYPLNSVGKVNAYPDISIKINEPNSEGIGEIYVKTELIMKGYFKEPELTNSAFEHGYFKTGDLGYIDKKGYLYLVGRSKDTIALNNGEKVSAVDVDEYYQKTVPNAHIACCALKNKDGYDEIHMFIENNGMEPEQLDNIRKSLLEKSRTTEVRYKLTDIHNIEKIPVTALGKVKRFILKEQLSDNAIWQSSETDITPTVSIEEVIFTIIKQFFGKSDIEKTMTLKDDLGFDSLKIFELCAEIEKKFNIRIAEKVPVNSTVNDLLELVQEPNRTNIQKNYKIKDYPKPKGKKDIAFIEKFSVKTTKLWGLKITGSENIPKGESIILCPNHESYFDAAWVSCALYNIGFPINNICTMAAEHLMEKPLFRRGFTALGGIPVDRDGNTLPALERAFECLKQEKCILIIHPEGTRTRTGELSIFKTGAAKLSIDAGVKIIPVCIDGAYEIFPPNRRLPRIKGMKNKLSISFGKPIKIDGKTESQITNEIREKIIEMKEVKK